jgi:S-methylmethionine-dependent homocysteine/selenocysteine methylase
MAWEGEADGEAWVERVWEVVVGARERGVWAGLLVGGCCHTGCEDVKGLRRKIDEVAGGGRDLDWFVGNMGSS